MGVNLQGGNKKKAKIRNSIFITDNGLALQKAASQRVLNRKIRESKLNCVNQQWDLNQEWYETNGRTTNGGV